jgi:predicted pyridoxine 5'-phosphate oxidase superfamily flavin-nucleotide-binding protein
MATLTADMKTFIENNLAWITTVDKDGNLDLGPKMSMFVLDDNHLAYHERTAGQHYENLKNGSAARWSSPSPTWPRRRATASAAP